jgi:MOSC domain-containing protein YiiM
VGADECLGQRLCEPCAHLERLTERGTLRGLVHRGGLRADVLSDGPIEVGAAVEAIDR